MFISVISELRYSQFNLLGQHWGWAGGRLKKKVVKKPLMLPARAKVNELFEAMENNGSVGGGGAEAADFCRFMLMSGARVGEVAVTTWHLIHWDRQLVHLPGFKSETSARFVPLFSELAILLRKVQERRKSAARFNAEGRAFLEPTDSIFRIKECQRPSMPRANESECNESRITTSGICSRRLASKTAWIIPTVSRWLGHNDGGVLAMKTYGHLRPDRSLMAAQKVHFGNGPVQSELAKSA